MQWHLEEAKRIFAPSIDVPPLLADVYSVESYLRTYFFKMGGVNVVPQNVLLRSGPIRGKGAGERIKDALNYLAGQQKVVIGQDAKRKCFINAGQGWQWG